MIGARLPLDEWEKGIELVAQGVKVVLEVRPGAERARAGAGS